MYDWDGKRDACYDLYIRQRQSLDEIMQGFRDVGFTPSKRAFQTQFKRWGFPSKQNPAHRNSDLVSRVKELWENNVSQRDMLAILNEEGFDLRERELMRVRTKNRWLLRSANGMRPKLSNGSVESTESNHGAPHEADPEATSSGAGQDGPELDQTLLSGVQEAAAEEQQPNGNSREAGSPSLAPELVEQRKRRREELQKDSDERYQSRKRRRRTRGWGGLPADPPAPPRFPSETTIDESKAFLEVDNDTYRELRDHFQRICEEQRIIKKTLAGPEQWHAAKDRLIQESPHLQTVFWGDATNHERKALALDVICSDVTKRMRTLEQRMTIAGAKNVLGINPEESRLVRNAFYAILKADHFTSKIEAGDAHWKELKDQWIATTPLIQNILAPGTEDPQHAIKLKAMEVLCRDVMKRLRDDQVKADPSRKLTKPAVPTTDKPDANSRDSQPAAITRNTRSAANTSAVRSAAPHSEISSGMSSLASRALASTPLVISEVSDMQIDPTLLEAAAGTALQHSPPPLIPSVPVYFRLHPQSRVEGPSIWLDRLISRSHAGLQQALGAKYPGVVIVRIDGVEAIAKDKELSWQIDSDDELKAYLDHVKGKKATFQVQIDDP